MARVTGPLGAVIHHLGLIGWDMIDPWTLKDQEHCIHDLRQEAPKEVKRRVVEHAQDAAFALTVDTRPHDGVGLSDGTDLHATRKALEAIEKDDPAMGNLAAVAARGGCWTGDRLARSNMGDALCSQCNVEEDICHLVYECPKYQALRCKQQASALAALRAYRERGTAKGITTALAFWTRGILPAGVLGPVPLGHMAAFKNRWLPVLHRERGDVNFGVWAIYGGIRGICGRTGRHAGRHAGKHASKHTRKQANTQAAKQAGH